MGKEIEVLCSNWLKVKEENKRKTQNVPSNKRNELKHYYVHGNTTSVVEIATEDSGVLRVSSKGKLKKD